MAHTNTIAKRTDSESVHIPDSFMLDIAATIYPCARTDNWNNVYRMAVIMKDEVRPELLEQALSDLWQRIPTFCSSLRKGLFWYYLQRVDKPEHFVTQESYYPCRRLELFNPSKPMFRVMYYKNRICLECSHILADGGSTVVILRSLITGYLRLCGVNAEYMQDMLKPDDKPTKEELSDAFRENYIPMKGLTRNEDNSYQYKAEVTPNYFKLIHGLVPVSDLKAAAKARALSITDYLLAAYLYAFYLDANGRFDKPIKVSIPVSLRPVFGSNTLRNFSSFSNIGIYPREEKYSFDEIVELIRGKIAQSADREKLQKDISKNVGDSVNTLVRFLPNAIKSPILKFGFKYKGQNKMVSTISNLGIFKMSPEAESHIERVEIMLSELPMKSIGCALVTFGGYMNISFSGHTKEARIERLFFKFLSDSGIPVRVECNDKELWS